jgi:hypothetical protein
MHSEDRAVLLCLWNALVVFGCLTYLTGSAWRAAMVAGVVLLSSALGYGQRWLYRGGFALMLITIIDASGLLPPFDQWSNLARYVQVVQSPVTP